MDEGVSFLIIFILLILSAFFSGSETAFFSLDELTIKKLEKLKKSNKEKEENKGIDAKSILSLLAKPRELLILILLGNTIVNVAASAIATTIALTLFPHSHTLVLFFDIIIMTSVILIFGEVIPKIIAISYAEKFASISSFFLRFLKILFWPVVKILFYISKFFSDSDQDKDEPIPVNQIKDIISSEITGKISVWKESKNIISRVFSFNKKTADDIMQPRVDIIAIDKNESYEYLKNIILKNGHSKIPVYSDSIDKIIGYVYAKDMALNLNTKDWHGLIRKDLLFVPENMLISNILKVFVKQKKHIAIVVDEYGVTSGLITDEDIFEELVGEIGDEYDKKELPPITKLKDNLYRINAMTSLTELNAEFSLDLPEDIYTNLAEYIVGELDRFPKPKERLIYKKKVKFVVEQIKEHRIISLLMEFIDKSNDKND